MRRKVQNYLLAQPIERQIGAKSRVSNNANNRSQYEKMKVGKSPLVPAHVRNRSPEQLAKELDKVHAKTAEAKRAGELAKAYTELVKAEAAAEKALAALRKQVLNYEISKEKFIAEYQIGLNKLNLIRQEQGVSVAGNQALDQSSYNKFATGIQHRLVGTNEATVFERGSIATGQRASGRGRQISLAEAS